MFSRIALILLVALGLAAAGAGWLWWQYGHAPVVQAGAKSEFDVRKGQAASQLAPTLREAGVAVEPWQLALAWRLRGDAPQLRAGRYLFEGPVTLQVLMDQLITGQPDRERTVVLLEGWTFRQFRDALAKAPDLVSTIADLDDAAVMQKIDPAEPHPEGLFAPDTFSYRLGSTDLELLARAYKLQQQRVESAWAGRSTGLATVKSPRELLILASIIEKESGRPEDRPLVSSVFHNRLRIGMPMQSDPTTIYGLGDRFDGNLTRAHLRGDTPYNTYVRNGLTPTPIAMPGMDALRAAATPADTKYLYFVARGDGTTEFSNDLASHNRAVNKFQRLPRT